MRMLVLWNQTSCILDWQKERSWKAACRDQWNCVHTVAPKPLTAALHIGRRRWAEASSGWRKEEEEVQWWKRERRTCGLEAARCTSWTLKNTVILYVTSFFYLYESCLCFLYFFIVPKTEVFSQSQSKEKVRRHGEFAKSMTHMDVHTRFRLHDLTAAG